MEGEASLGLNRERGRLFGQQRFEISLVAEEEEDPHPLHSALYRGLPCGPCSFCIYLSMYFRYCSSVRNTHCVLQ